MTEIGSPGRLQGLNVGVLLLNLEKIRKNKVYHELLTSKGINQLVSSFGFYNTFLGNLPFDKSTSHHIYIYKFQELKTGLH